MASNIPGKEFTIPKTHQIAKSKNFENILNLQASNLAPTSGNSLVVCSSVIMRKRFSS